MKPAIVGITYADTQEFSQVPGCELMGSDDIELATVATYFAGHTAASTEILQAAGDLLSGELRTTLAGRSADTNASQTNAILSRSGDRLLVWGEVFEAIEVSLKGLRALKRGEIRELVDEPCAPGLQPHHRRAAIKALRKLNAPADHRMVKINTAV